LLHWARQYTIYY